MSGNKDVSVRPNEPPSKVPEKVSYKWKYIYEEKEFYFCLQDDILDYKYEDLKNRIHLRKRNHKPIYECDETEVDHTDIFSFRVLIKIKNNKLSPISTLFIRKSQLDEHMLSFSLDTLDKQGLLVEIE